MGHLAPTDGEAREAVVGLRIVLAAWQAQAVLTPPAPPPRARLV